MTIRAHLDDQFARQFGGLPQIEKPVSRHRDVMDELLDKVVGSLPLAGTLKTIYRVSFKDGELKAECVPESEWRLPDVQPPIAPGLVVNEYHMDGLLLGNADFEVNQQEAIFGICAEGDCSDDQ